jgi:hypothetical protein
LALISVYFDAELSIEFSENLRLYALLHKFSVEDFVRHQGQESSFS